MPDFRTVSRRGFTRALLASPAVPAIVSATGYAPAQDNAQPAGDTDELFAELDQKIRLGMKEFAIPGAAVAVFYNGQEFVRGYGVTQVNGGRQVDANTAFLTASVSKPVTGTAAMRLVDLGKLDLDAPVTRYIEDFQAPAGAEEVSVRQLLNHSAGWDGDDQFDTGEGDDALAKYVEAIHRLLPQQTPVGLTFAYNNAAIGVAGRVIEKITGETFESSVQSLVLDPLGMTRSSYFLSQLGKGNVAMPHAVKNGAAVAMPEWLLIPRDQNPFGGLVASVADLLAFARFHLGNGRAANGKRVMSEVALRSMWSQPGPGGTLILDLKGMGVAWSIRPTIEGVSVVEHAGDWPGYHPFLMTVPEKQFAMVLLNNSDGGTQLRSQIFFYDWALERFAGVHNLPASPQSLSASELAQYEGDYLRQYVDRAGNKRNLVAELRATDGGLELTITGAPEGESSSMLRFYRYDRVVDPLGNHADFLREANGQIKWFRQGRLYARQA